MADGFSIKFPDLGDVASKKTSEADPVYNCIAWAFGDNIRWWWPNMFSYWPLDHYGKSTLQAFQEWFESDGWVIAKSHDYEPDLRKVALYTLNGEPTHAARLLPSGMWTSKLGQNIDLSHKLNDLDGPEYGSVFSVYQKPGQKN